MGTQGWVERGFEGVVAAFERNFSEREEVGAAFAAYLDGSPIVDLWGGVADVKTGRPWTEDTICVVFSTTKGVASICAHLLVERGLLDLDAPVARYWPEFAQAGKGAIPVRWILSHQAGLAAVEASDLTTADVLAGTRVVEALARQAPNWEPGTAHGYHMMTYGWLVGEIVRRITGKSLGAFFQAEIAAPLRLDFWIGLPESEEPRVARLLPPGLPDLTNPMTAQLADPESLTTRVMRKPALALSAYNERATRAAEIASASGVGTARALARLYGSLVHEVDGLRLLSRATIDRATETQARGKDLVMMLETHFGLGFALPAPFNPMGGPSSFGHPGAGGSVAFADKARRLSVAYIMNSMRPDLGTDARSRAPIAALYAALEGPAGKLIA
jgi:CubicO group peptidase (beta-lactamase class C family)